MKLMLLVAVIIAISGLLMPMLVKAPLSTRPSHVPSAAVRSID